MHGDAGGDERARSTGARIVVVSQVPPPVHGSTVMTQRLLDTLGELGVEATLVDRRFSNSVGEVGALSMRKIGAAPSLVARLAAATRRRPDAALVFLTNRKASFLMDCAMLALLRARRVPVITYLHTTGFRRLSESGSAMARLVRFSLRSGHRVVVLGDRLASDIEPWVDPAAIVVIPNATPAIASPAPRASDGPLAVGFLSNLIAEKGADTFVEVARACQARGVSARFVVAGAPADAGLHDTVLAAQSELGTDVFDYRGAVDAHARAAFFSEIDVLLFPTRYRYEAQPLTIVEAFSCGVPVIASDMGGIADIVHDGENGRVIGAGDVTAAVDILAELSGPDGSVEALAQGAARSYRSTHSPEAYADAWDRLLAPFAHAGTPDASARPAQGAT